MTKIESVKLSSFRNDDHHQFMSYVDKLILTHQTTELGVQGLYLDFKTLLDKESSINSLVQTSIKSKMIVDLDSQRDNTWSAISTRVKASLLSPVADEAESARILKIVLDKHGDVRNRSYHEESSAISGLVRDLQNSPNAAHAQAIGITSWVESLKTQNENFITILDERSEEYSDRPDSNVRLIREQIDPIYQQMVEKINASIVLELAKPAVESFVLKLNEKIAYFKTTIASRQARSKDKAAETSTEKA